MNNKVDKAVIHQMLLDNKEAIIQKYNEGKRVYEIAEIYKVAESTIYIKLGQWGVRKRKSKRAFRRIGEKPAKFKRVFSPEFLANREKNTKTNNKYIKFYRTVETKDDRFLVKEILKKAEVIK